jgi:hypothetical protein
MSALADFLEGLFSRGEVVLHEPPSADGDSPRARDLLYHVYCHVRLQLAGPLIDFDADTATRAAAVLWRACWFLLDHGEPPETLERLLVLSSRDTAAAHLSADLTLRYLPQIHRRASSLLSVDILPSLLAKILREWPLSGVLSEITDGPLTRLEFSDHPGLMLLYAERLAEHSRPAWVPTGRTWEYLELVYQSTGRDMPSPEPDNEKHAHS